jgi:ABC-type transport system involved in cytochrome c biogenesis permease subunit
MLSIKTFCFLASYSLALALELLHLRFSRPVLRVLALLAAFAGLVAHTLYLYARQPPLVEPFSWLLFLSWILVIFYLSGAVHHRRLSWGIFVLPLIVGLVVLGLLLEPPAYDHGLLRPSEQPVPRLWGLVHAVLILLATVGVCVGFVASLMYLIQSHRLRTKTLPGHGLKLLSLERLESMNRRAVVVAFPLLTAGMLLGLLLMLNSNLAGWTDPRVLATAVLWITFALLLYLRYGRHARGRQVAFMTIAAFLLLLCCLALSHPLGQGEVAP